MIKIDLVTGFLGSGKTTFIKRYVGMLKDKGNKVGILENDFGAVNVDMMLLGELADDNCDIETVAGACDKDCHIRRFKTKLIAMGMGGYDRVVVEPSGIFDTDEFFDVLREYPLDSWYEIGNVIAVADAQSEDELSEQSEYLFASQLANAGVIMLSRIQETEKNDIQKTVQHIAEAVENLCGRQLKDEIIAEDWSQLSEEKWNSILCCGHYKTDFIKRFSREDIYRSVYYLNVDISLSKLRQSAEKIFNLPECGKIYRIKGFVLEDGQWYELNAARNCINIKPIVSGQKVIIVIGESPDKDAIDKVMLP